MEDQKRKFDFQSLQDLKFPGHEVLKNRLPKAMELVDAVAEEWQKDGDFNGLPVGHPITQVALGLGLRKAKDIEKKLEKKGVFTMAQIGYEYAKVQAAKIPLEKLPLDRLPEALVQYLKKNSSANSATRASASEDEFVAADAKDSSSLDEEANLNTEAHNDHNDHDTSSASSTSNLEAEIVAEDAADEVEINSPQKETEKETEKKSEKNSSKHKTHKRKN